MITFEDIDNAGLDTGLRCCFVSANCMTHWNKDTPIDDHMIQTTIDYLEENLRLTFALREKMKAAQGNGEAVNGHRR